MKNCVECANCARHNLMWYCRVENEGRKKIVYLDKVTMENADKCGERQAR